MNPDLRPTSLRPTTNRCGRFAGNVTSTLGILKLNGQLLVMLKRKQKVKSGLKLMLKSLATDSRMLVFQITPPALPASKRNHKFIKSIKRQSRRYIGGFFVHTLRLRILLIIISSSRATYRRCVAPYTHLGFLLHSLKALSMNG